MLNEVTVLNIREYLAATENGRFGEEELKELLSEFSCSKNSDVERFLKKQAIEFTKKNQSVTYLVFHSIPPVFQKYKSLCKKPQSRCQCSAPRSLTVLYQASSITSS